MLMGDGKDEDHRGGICDVQEEGVCTLGGGEGGFPDVQGKTFDFWGGGRGDKILVGDGNRREEFDGSNTLAWRQLCTDSFGVGREVEKTFFFLGGSRKVK